MPGSRLRRDSLEIFSGTNHDSFKLLHDYSFRDKRPLVRELFRRSLNHIKTSSTLPLQCGKDRGECVRKVQASRNAADYLYDSQVFRVTKEEYDNEADLAARVFAARACSAGECGEIALDGHFSLLELKITGQIYLASASAQKPLASNKTHVVNVIKSLDGSSHVVDLHSCKIYPLEARYLAENLKLYCSEGDEYIQYLPKRHFFGPHPKYSKLNNEMILTLYQLHAEKWAEALRTHRRHSYIVEDEYLSQFATKPSSIGKSQMEHVLSHEDISGSQIYGTKPLSAVHKLSYKPKHDSMVIAEPARKRWIPDSESSTCMASGCSTKLKRFSRHHCRSCGILMCSSCSQTTIKKLELYILIKGDAEVEYTGKQKVCPECNDLLASAY